MKRLAEMKMLCCLFFVEGNGFCWTYLAVFVQGPFGGPKKGAPFGGPFWFCFNGKFKRSRLCWGASNVETNPIAHNFSDHGLIWFLPPHSTWARLDFQTDKNQQLDSGKNKKRKNAGEHWRCDIGTQGIALHVSFWIRTGCNTPSWWFCGRRGMSLFFFFFGGPSFQWK